MPPAFIGVKRFRNDWPYMMMVVSPSGNGRSTEPIIDTAPATGPIRVTARIGTTHHQLSPAIASEISDQLDARLEQEVGEHDEADPREQLRNADPVELGQLHRVDTERRLQSGADLGDQALRFLRRLAGLGRQSRWLDEGQGRGQLVVVGDSDRGGDRPLDSHHEGGRHEQLGDVERTRVVAGDQPGVLEPGEPGRIAIEDQVRQGQRAVGDPASMQQPELAPQIVECRLGHLVAGELARVTDPRERRGR